MKAYCPRCNQMRPDDGLDTFYYPSCTICKTKLIDPEVTITFLNQELDKERKENKILREEIERMKKAVREILDTMLLEA